MKTNNIYIISNLPDINIKSFEIHKTSSKIKCYILIKRLLKTSYAVTVSCYKYPNILQYQIYYYQQ